MLGGYPSVSRVDIAGSRTFLSKLRRLSNPNSTLPSPPAKLRLVADCGAGIGRITTNFLVTVAEHVDVVEPVQKFTDQLRAEHPKLFSGDDPVVQHVFNTALEDFTPPKERVYDVIWNQWCVGHLTDDALSKYLTRLVPHLAPGGYTVVKENLSTHPFGEDVYDDEDSSVTRSKDKFEQIFENAGLVVRRSEVQGGGFGRGLGLMPVRMWGLQPKEGWATREQQQQQRDGESEKG